jgi:hypothetical protein
MVPLSAPLARSIGSELSDMRACLRAEWRPESPEAGLVEWAAHASGSVLEFERRPLSPSQIAGQRWNEAPVLAAIGYRMAIPSESAVDTNMWREGMQRLMSRDAVPADRNSFFFRPVELLGISLGASALRDADPSPSSWLRDLVAEHRGHLQVGGLWTSVLTRLAESQVGAVAERARLDPKSTLETALLTWLHLVDGEAAASVSAVGREAACRDLLLDVSRARPEIQGLAELGVVCIALDRAVRAAIEGLDLRTTGAADFVVNLCRRFPLLASELDHRHAGRETLAMADEYDVQDLLRAVLRMHFDDVRPEEWNPSYGGVGSRSDLLIKSERLVVETKMTRKNLGQREVIEELTVDKAQYRTHPDCETLVCFVYDPEKRLTNPTALEADLSEVAEHFTTKVVVSPRGL